MYSLCQLRLSFTMSVLLLLNILHKVVGSCGGHLFNMVLCCNRYLTVIRILIFLNLHFSTRVVRLFIVTCVCCFVNSGCYVYQNMYVYLVKAI